MDVHYRVPRGPLSDFVELFWLYDPYVVSHAKERLLPGATTELVIDLRPAARRSSAVVSGPHSEYFGLDTSEAMSLLGVHFRPGGAFPFFGVPAGELHNLGVSLEVLWGTRAAELRERVLAAQTTDTKFDVVERMLLDTASTLARHRAVAFAVRELSAVPQPRTIGQVTDAVGMSQRCFIERFRDEVGMTPKLFARVQRFQQVVKTVHPLKKVDWADIAAACGYFDQAHFIHDFRAFSGLTPGAYSALKDQHQNHVPLSD